jgi:predicted DsbA family dithiol-disulfide isomerase
MISKKWVPFIAFNMALGVSGAQSTEVFTQALAQAWEREKEMIQHHD